MSVPQIDPLKVKTVHFLLDTAVGWAELVIVVSFLVLVVVSTLRQLLSVRGRFNETCINRWLAGVVPVSGAVGSLFLFFVPRLLQRSIYRDERDKDTETELLTLTVGGHDSSGTLYSQPTAKMMAQIQLASNTAADHPHKYKNLYKFLTSTELRKREGSEMSDDADLWMKLCEQLDAVPEAEAIPTTDEPSIAQSPTNSPVQPSDPEVRNASRARARLDNVIARKLDALQAQIERGWENANLTVSAFFGVVIAMLFYDTAFGPWYLSMLIAVGIVSGFVGNFLTNLAGALDRLARPS